MAVPRMVLIAAPELIPALRERVGGGDEDLVTFADSEPVLALEAICAERPTVIALERLFAASPRGAALIARIKADASLDDIEIRILSHDSDYSRVSPRAPRTTAPAHLPVPRRAPLDTGTRRAPRFRLQEGVTMMVENRPTTVVDLSELGAQVVGRSPLKPKQQVRALLDPGGGRAGTAGNRRVGARRDRAGQADAPRGHRVRCARPADARALLPRAQVLKRPADPGIHRR